MPHEPNDEPKTKYSNIHTVTCTFVKAFEILKTKTVNPSNQLQ